VKEYGFTSYCLTEKEIASQADKTYGAKSSNLVALRAVLPASVQAPSSAVIPFGTFGKVLNAPENADVKREYAKHTGELSEKNAVSKLRQIQECITKLVAPTDFKSALQKGLQDSGVVTDSASVEWDRAFEATKQVWASVWNERAHLACSKQGLQMQHIEMAVLVQKLVEAEYAFVLHTANPLSGDASEMYGEVVVGQGEALVGNHPGRALGFTCKKDGSSGPVVKSLPSKTFALFGHGLIFRSDSNAEDLPGFAGAGLFDSVPMTEHQQSVISYRHERLVQDASFQEQLMQQLCSVALEVEKACKGVAQDIEGCWHDGKLYVVQTRPQVGL